MVHGRLSVVLCNNVINNIIIILFYYIILTSKTGIKATSEEDDISDLSNSNQREEGRDSSVMSRPESYAVWDEIVSYGLTRASPSSITTYHGPTYVSSLHRADSGL